MLIRFTDRSVIVTGAAQGIGRAIVAGFAQAGARVWALDMDADGLALAASAGAAETRRIDLADRDAVRDAIADVVAAAGRLDILVNGAGGVRGQVQRPIEDVPEQDWRVLFEANVNGAFFMSQAAAPQMKRLRAGRIVNIASGAGRRPSLTGIQAYAAAKHALVGLTRQLALELGPFGITVNAVAPGFVLSNPATRAQWESYGPEGQKRLVEGIHLRRLGRAEDIADAVLFLASDRAAWITGQVLSVDGGRA